MQWSFCILKTLDFYFKEPVTRFWADLDGRDVLKEAMWMVYGLLLLPLWCTVDPDLTVLVCCQQAAAVCPTEVG